MLKVFWFVFQISPKIYSTCTNTIILSSGIWADDSDDERPAFGRGKKGKADWTAPIGFVSGGVKVGDTISKDGEEGEGGDDSVSLPNEVPVTQNCQNVWFSILVFHALKYLL